MTECSLNATLSNVVNAILRHYLVNVPKTPYVCLSGCRIAHVNALLPSLAELRHMLSLDLSDNQISSLPSGAELAMCMPQLRTLDLSRNPLVLDAALVDCLASLRELHSLYIQLPDSRAIRWLAQCLPQLRAINGVKLVPPDEEHSGVADAGTQSCAMQPSLEVGRRRNFSGEVGKLREAYHRLEDCIRELRLFCDNSIVNLDKDRAMEKNLLDVNTRIANKIHLTHSTSFEEEIMLFKSLFQDAVETLILTTHHAKSDSTRVKDTLDVAVHMVFQLYSYYNLLEPTTHVSVEDAMQSSRVMKMLRELKANWALHTARSNTEVERPEFSLLSLLGLVRKMAWCKQRKEKERRGERLWNECYYYETMQQYMYAFFVEQYPLASEVEISAHIVRFIRSLNYYAKVENSVEAYVFSRVLNNAIEESYWTLFVSLCTTISDTIERSVLLKLTQSDTTMNMPDAGDNEEESKGEERQWLRHCAHHGLFLSKDDVFRVIDMLIPPSQLDGLLYMDLIEAAVALLASTCDHDNNPGRRNSTVTSSSLLRTLITVFVNRHERSISPIVRAFNAVCGAGSVGIITVNQLRDILRRIDSPTAATLNFFESVRDAATGSLADVPITFSSVVEATRRQVQKSFSPA